MLPIQENAARKPSVNQIFEVFFDTYTNKPQSTAKCVFQVRKRILYLVSAVWVLLELVKDVQCIFLQLVTSTM